MKDVPLAWLEELGYAVKPVWISFEPGIDGQARQGY
jgi:hypothetical protein